MYNQPVVESHKIHNFTLLHRLLRLRLNFLCFCRKVECVLLTREVATEVALLTTEVLLWVRCNCDADGFDSSITSL